jgi:hypothetical protein
MVVASYLAPQSLLPREQEEAFRWEERGRLDPEISSLVDHFTDILHAVANV